jgi:hypothetical protein
VGESVDFQPKRKTTDTVIETDQQQANRRCYQHRSWPPGKLTPSLQDWQKYQKIPNSLENGQKDNRQHGDVA